MKIFLFGDSFGADFSVKTKETHGWVHQLAQFHDVHNVCTAGASQYRICNQLRQVNINDYDLAIMCATSPTRIFTPSHVLHKHDPLHHSCDLIVADLEDAILNRGINEPSVTSAYDFYKYHVDIDALEFEYKLKIDWCVQQCKPIPFIVTSYTDLTAYNFPKYVQGNDLLASNPGNNNWLDTRGNIIMTKRIIDAITELT